MKKREIKLYIDITGNNISVPRYDFGKGKKGLYIQGGVHGGEVTYFIFERLYNFLKQNEKKLNGVVTLVPIVNPVSWNQRIYYYTVGKFDLYKGKDWNRSYNSDPNTTMSARNSQKLFDIAKRYKVSIDLHTARMSRPYSIYFDKKVEEIVKICGIRYNYFIKNSKADGSFNHSLLKAGVNSLAIECGEHDSYNVENIKEVENAIKNLISQMKLIEKEEINKNVVQTTSKIKTIFSPISGFVKYNFNPRDTYKKGDILCEIISSSDIGKKKKVVAQECGIMFELARTNIAWVGDELIRVIDFKDLRDID